jgi:CRP-like cAMP-binding protein
MDIGVLEKQQLKGGYLLAALAEPEFEAVLAHASIRTLAQGERLFDQGDPCTHFFFVLSGIIKLCRVSPSGEEKVMDLVRPGQYFAEAVMFMGGRYPVHARALETTRLVSLENKHFLELVRGNGDLCLRLLSTMSQRMHGLINEIDNLTLHSGAQRVMGYLLEQLPEGAAPHSVRLLVPKHVIASRLGIQPETLSRVLARLRGEHLIDVQDDTIVLNDVEALRRLSSVG